MNRPDIKHDVRAICLFLEGLDVLDFLGFLEFLDVLDFLELLDFLDFLELLEYLDFLDNLDFLELLVSLKLLCPEMAVGLTACLLVVALMIFLADPELLQR